MKKMKNCYGATVALMWVLTVQGQVITLDPEFPTPTDSVIVQFDATKGAAGLQGFAGEVYAHTGVLTSASTSDSDWKYVKTEWGENTPETQMTRVDTDLYQITIGPSIRDYYGVPESETITHITFVFRSADTSLEGKDAGGADILAEVLNDAFAMTLNSPSGKALFLDTGDTISITASASQAADFTLTIGGADVAAAAQSGVEGYQFDWVVPEVEGTVEVVLTANDGANVVTRTFTYVIRSEGVNSPRPDGVIEGINYNASDDTKVTLSLRAPGKSSAFVVGDFNDWQIATDFQMKRDGEYFWLALDGLEAGVEYAFQYLVDESIYIADPYADKILDRNNDEFIPSSIYPDLKTYPEAASNPVPEYNVVSVFETGQTPFAWQNTDFEPPQAEELVVYELLVRDFFGDGEESYINLIDTLSYIKSLGVNAIELMPITEFSGNDSWGYNPIFMFAPDKAYGTKDDLKAFIDAAHGLGMAVILDMVLNHQDQPSPFVLLDYDLENSRPTPDNPYFNETAAHPFNVFFDMNHESAYTQHFVDTVNHYWIHEYHFDGYRFDLSKGFTQRRTSDVGVWSAYDADRIALLKRMSDVIWSHSAEAYVILEHFGDNDEEIELAAHGMMLWGNAHFPFKQNILGYEENADISSVYHATRGWDNAHLVGYMESHDEQRQIFEALEFGNANSDYSVQELPNALNRMEAGFAMLLTIPGPKLFWQFGEMGYDVDINFNGRTGQKPTPWDASEGHPYYGDYGRSLLRQRVAAMVELKASSRLFSLGRVEFTDSQTLEKQMIIRNNPYTASPTGPEDMNAVFVANFDLTSKTFSVTFPHTGTWYNYFSSQPLEVGSSTESLELGAGSYAIFTDVALERPDIVLDATFDGESSGLKIYPNPASEFIEINFPPAVEPLYYALFDVSGKRAAAGKFAPDLSRIAVSSLQGLYLLEVITRTGEVHHQRVLIE